MRGWVGGLRKHPYGRVDQLEDRYLGMVEAPSSNLGTSTPLLLIDIEGVDRAAKTVHLLIASVFGSARPPEKNQSRSVGRLPKPSNLTLIRFLARHVHHSVYRLRVLN